MATSLQTLLQFLFQPKLTLGSGATFAGRFGSGFTWANGVAINQSDQLYLPDPITIAASGSPSTLDLSGALTQPGGASLALVSVTALGIVNLDAANYIKYGPHSSNGMTSMFTGTTPFKRIGPLGFDFCANPFTTAFGVTAGTADVLQVACESGTNVQYQIVIVGRSA